MFNRIARSVALAAVATLADGSLLRAEDAPATGAISGSVTDASGRPLSGVTILFFGSAQQTQRGSDDSGGAKAGKRAAEPRTPVELAKGVLRGKVATDAAGKFEIKTLHAGAYTYRAGNPQSAAVASGDVTVEAGKTTTLTIKLAASGR